MKLRPKIIQCDGEVHSQRGWARVLGASGATVCLRLKRGWPACRAATMPVNAAISAAVKLSWRLRALRRLVRVGGRLRLKQRSRQRMSLTS